MDRKLRKKQLAVKMANNQLKILSVFDKKSLIAARILTGDYSLEIDDWGFLIASSETIIKLSNYLKKDIDFKHKYTGHPTKCLFGYIIFRTLI